MIRPTTAHSSARWEPCALASHRPVKNRPGRVRSRTCIANCGPTPRTNGNSAANDTFPGEEATKLPCGATHRVRACRARATIPLPTEANVW